MLGATSLHHGRAWQRVSPTAADGFLSGNQRMDSQLTSLGIAHDPLQIIDRIGHDLSGLKSRIGYNNLNFAASHFP